MSTVTDLIPRLIITKTASMATVTPGTAVQYTITVADAGQTSYTGATVTDSLAGVLGSATYDNDAIANAGSVSYSNPVLTWTGNLAPGVTASITYSVMVSNPETGSTTMTNTAISNAAGSNCPSGTTASRCGVTVGIVGGVLSITAPTGAALGAAPPGGTIAGSLGIVQVTDTRGFGAGWTVSVSSTDFGTGGGSPAEVIPAGDATYGIGGFTADTGPASFNFIPSVGLGANPQAVASATNVAGNTGVSWNPEIQLAVPGGAVGGSYSGTIYHSVS
jgi:uncharacterized repeat protein (TIGR01451 family)